MLDCVFKIGGGDSLNLEAFLEDFACFEGRAVLVHGGNAALTSLQESLGWPPRMIKSPSGQSSRFTDRRTMELFWMVYRGKINAFIVEFLQKKGVNAVGLSGMDGQLALGKRRSKIRVVDNGRQKVLYGDFAGSVEVINTKLLELLLKSGYVPVITPPALSYEMEAINVDGDKLACQIAIAMKARKLSFFLSAAGMLRDKDDEDSLIDEVCGLDEIDKVMKMAGGRMKKKILAAKWALEAGILSVTMSDGRVKEPIKKVESGLGTVFTMS